MPINDAILATIAAVITSGAMTALINYGLNRRQTESQVKTADIKSLNETIATLQKENKRLCERLEETDGRVDAMDKEIEAMQRRERFLLNGVYTLIGQLERHGIVPAWTPEEEVFDNVGDDVHQS
jgi:predicted RNase H-like nuclease (RuvC/YqgF family)